MVDKLKDAIYGLAVGDALGVPFEFEERGTFYCKNMVGNGTHKQPVGTWSDDTSMTLATCDSYKKIGFIDCGYTCSEAIYNKCGFDDIMSNGNGSLMRILPLAFIPDISDHMIEEVSAITHAYKQLQGLCVKGG